MRADDFLVIHTDPLLPPEVEVRVDLLEQLRRGPLSFSDDGESAEALTRLLHRELEAYGSGNGWRIGDDDVALGLKALRATLHRLGTIFHAANTVRDVVEFKKYWNKGGEWIASSPTNLDRPFGSSTISSMSWMKREIRRSTGTTRMPRGQSVLRA